MATAGLTTPAVQLLDEPEAIYAALSKLANNTKYEMLSALSDANVSASAMRSSWDRDIEMLDRGVDGRIIYPAQAARRPDVMEYLTQFAARGAKVRVLGTIPNRMIIADRVRAIVPETPEHPTGPALLVSGKVLVRALYTEFLEMWRSSLPVGFSTGGLDVDMVRTTLQALSDGLTDDAAARKNGWSVRTYRRRIAGVMELLGTASRFEAGALAREQGWI